jgi:hypothetical protein
VSVGRQERGGRWEGSTDGRAHDDSLFTAIKQNQAGDWIGDCRVLPWGASFELPSGPQPTP